MGKIIGLALSGGGARGFAHVGVLNVLARHGISIDMVAGTSAGSIVGGALAAGMTATEIDAMSAKAGFAGVMRPTVPIRGLFSNARLGKFIKNNFPTTDFADLKIPFAAVAFDLGNSEKVVIRRGDLATAIRASCAVPGVFTPVLDASGRHLVDGGVVSPLPVDVLREMGADIVIAVDVIACGSSFRTNSRTGVGIMIQSALALLREIARSQHAFADIVITPQMAHLRPDQIGKRPEFIDLGEQAAEEQIEEIKRLVTDV